MEAAILLFAAIDCSCVPRSVVVPMRRASRKRSMGKAAKSGRRAKVTHLDLQPDALGVATRLAAGRLREAGIVLKPLLKSAGLFAGQINRKGIRIGVASQIRFLELAAKALNDPLLGFRLVSALLRAGGAGWDGWGGCRQPLPRQHAAQSRGSPLSHARARRA